MLTPTTTEAMATMQIPGLPQRLHQVGLEWGPEPCMAASTPHDSHMNGKEREKKEIFENHWIKLCDKLHLSVGGRRPEYVYCQKSQNQESDNSREGVLI